MQSDTIDAGIDIARRHHTWVICAKDSLELYDFL